MEFICHSECFPILKFYIVLYWDHLNAIQVNCILLYFLILDFAYSPKGRYGCFFLGDVENFKDFSPDTRCYPEKIFHLTMS